MSHKSLREMALDIADHIDTLYAGQKVVPLDGLLLLYGVSSEVHDKVVEMLTRWGYLQIGHDGVVRRGPGENGPRALARVKEDAWRRQHGSCAACATGVSPALSYLLGDIVTGFAVLCPGCAALAANGEDMDLLLSDAEAATTNLLRACAEPDRSLITDRLLALAPLAMVGKGREVVSAWPEGVQHVLPESMEQTARFLLSSSTHSEDVLGWWRMGSDVALAVRRPGGVLSCAGDGESLVRDLQRGLGYVTEALKCPGCSAAVEAPADQLHWRCRCGTEFLQSSVEIPQEPPPRNVDIWTDIVDVLMRRVPEELEDAVRIALDSVDDPAALFTGITRFSSGLPVYAISPFARLKPWIEMGPAVLRIAAVLSGYRLHSYAEPDGSGSSRVTWRQSWTGLLDRGSVALWIDQGVGMFTLVYWHPAADARKASEWRHFLDSHELREGDWELVGSAPGGNRQGEIATEVAYIGPKPEFHSLEDAVRWLEAMVPAGVEIILSAAQRFGLSA